VKYWLNLEKQSKKLGSDGDSVLHKTLGQIGEEIFKIVEANYTGFRVSKTPNDDHILNTSLDICLEFDNELAARKIVKFCQDNFTEIDGK